MQGAHVRVRVRGGGGPPVQGVRVRVGGQGGDVKAGRKQAVAAEARLPT